MVEKSPFLAGVRTSSVFLVKITMIASEVVFPEMLMIRLSVTSSSIGLTKVKNIDGFGVGEGAMIEMGLLLEGTMLFPA